MREYCIHIALLYHDNLTNHCLEMYTDSTEIFNIQIYNPPSVLPNSNQESHNTGLCSTLYSKYIQKIFSQIYTTDGIDVHGQPFYVHDSVINTGDDNVAMHANDTLIENCQFGSGHK